MTWLFGRGSAALLYVWLIIELSPLLKDVTAAVIELILQDIPFITVRIISIAGESLKLNLLTQGGRILAPTVSVNPRSAQYNNLCSGYPSLDKISTEWSQSK